MTEAIKHIFEDPETSTDQMMYAYNNSSIVNYIIKSGGNIYDCIYWLVKHQEELQEKLIKLELISPKKIKLSDGKVVIWHCPDKLVPEIDINPKCRVI